MENETTPEQTFTVTDAAQAWPKQRAAWILRDLAPTGRARFSAWVEAGAAGVLDLSDPGLPVTVAAD